MFSRDRNLRVSGSTFDFLFTLILFPSCILMVTRSPDDAQNPCSAVSCTSLALASTSCLCVCIRCVSVHDYNGRRLRTFIWRVDDRLILCGIHNSLRSPYPLPRHRPGNYGFTAHLLVCTAVVICLSEAVPQSFLYPYVPMLGWHGACLLRINRSVWQGVYYGLLSYVTHTRTRTHGQHLKICQLSDLRINNVEKRYTMPRPRLR